MHKTGLRQILSTGDNYEFCNFPTYDQCMVESEAEAKSMARQWEWEREKTGRLPFFRAVEVRCEMQEARNVRPR